MPITHKTLSALVGVFIALIFGAAAILQMAVGPQFRRLEASQDAQNTARVAANLAAIETDLVSRVTDYATWDDTYDFMRRRNQNYVVDFTTAWFEQYGVDLVVFGAGDGEIVWARQGARGASGRTEEIAAELIAEVRSLQIQAPATGIAWIDGMGPIEYAVAPVTRSDGGGAPRGWAIIGRRLSASALRDQTQSEISFIDIHAAPGELAPHLAALADNETARWKTPDALYALRPLKKLDGSLAGALLTRQPRAVAALGDNAISTALWLFVAMAALAALALWAVLGLLVIRRIEHLEAHFDAQSAGLAPIPLDDMGRDEIARLAGAYNALIERVRDARTLATAAHAERDAQARANRMKSDFLANISHELRTPLDVIIGYSELVAEELTALRGEGLRKDVELITDSARQLLTFVNEILDLSRIEGGKLALKPQAFDVAAVLRDTAEICKELALESGAELHFETANDLGVAYSDQARIRQCLINILSYACKSNPNARVRLNAERRQGAGGDMLRFEIQNEGVTLSAEKAKKLFEPFADASHVNARRYGGNGLGLAITRQVATLLGGSLHVVCEDRNATTFTLSVAATLEEAEAFAQAA